MGRGVLKYVIPALALLLVLSIGFFGQSDDAPRAAGDANGSPVAAGSNAKEVLRFQARASATSPGGQSVAAADEVSSADEGSSADEAVPEQHEPKWVSYVAEMRGPTLKVHRRPSESSAVKKRLQRGRLDGGRKVFLVDRTRPGWLLVHLPTRPNHSKGWVRASRVTVSRNVYSVQLHLGRRMLTASKRGKVFLRARVAVGTPRTPTPRGLAYVTNLVRPIPASGPFGPYAFGLSVHSPTLDSFNGQEPQIAIHGTNAPRLLGQAITNGCIRMTNANIRKLARNLPLGTPVRIVGRIKA